MEKNEEKNSLFRGKLCLILSYSFIKALQGPVRGPEETGCEGARSQPGAERGPEAWAGRTHLLSSVFVAYWRFWLCVSVVYELFLIFILFQVSRVSGLDTWELR